MTSDSGPVRRAAETLVVGLLIGILAIIFAISFSAIVFSGPLARFLPQGIGIALFSATVLNTLIGLGSSYRGMIGPPQDMTAAILALAVAQFAALPALTVPGAPLFETAVVMLAVAALWTGLVLMALGRFRLGLLVRFIPYPVVGGFLAATGWLLIKGATGFMTGMPIELGTLARLGESSSLVAWVPGVLLGVAMLVASRRVKHAATLPVVLVLGGAVFYAVSALAGYPAEALQARGLLIGPLPPAGMWQPLTPDVLGRADWAAIGAAWPLLASTVALAVVGVLLNATGVEFATHREVDLDRELRAAGLANVAISAGGGLIGFQGLGLTVLAERLGDRSRAVPLVVALLSAVALFAGAGVLSFVPRMIVGGVTIFIGLDFLANWLVESRRRLPVSEYAIVLLIFAVAAGVGFLEGVAVGLFAGLVLFVLSYSRADIVRHRLTRATFRSNVDRPQADEQRLIDRGSEIEILVLEGYIFFGTAHRLIADIEARTAAEPRTVRFLVLDLRLVSGMDSSAVHAFAKLRRLAEQRGFAIVLSELPPAALAQFRRDAGGDQIGMPVLPDLDHAVEWCERRLLEEDPDWRDAPTDLLADCLGREVGDGEVARRIARYFEPLSLGDGAVVMEGGSRGRELYFIESGRLAVSDPDGGARSRRLRSILAGNVVGEVGLYLGLPRTATVVAEGACGLQRLSEEAFETMQLEEPAAAGALHKFVLRRAVIRLAHANRHLLALTR